MKEQKWEAFEASLTIVGDEAFLPGGKRPWHRLATEERLHYKRDWMRRDRARKRAAAGPRTEAGKRLLEAFFTPAAMPVDPAEAIIAIEVEAASRHKRPPAPSSEKKADQ